MLVYTWSRYDRRRRLSARGNVDPSQVALSQIYLPCLANVLAI